MALKHERLVLDTSAFSWMRRGHTGVLDAMADASVIVVPTTVLGELEGGFMRGSRYHDNAERLTEFLDEPFVMTLNVTASTARRYGEVYSALYAAGTPVSANDMWIAAATLDCGGHLLTLDSDFERISGLPMTRLAPI